MTKADELRKFREGFKKREGQRKIKVYAPDTKEVIAYYLICGNMKGKYQMVEFFSSKIYPVEYNNTNEVFEVISKAASKSGLKAAWCVCEISDIEILSMDEVAGALLNLL